MRSVGIALFTYHKYRKSIDSTVPLDAHGNAVGEDFEDTHNLHTLADEERQPLAAGADSELSEPMVFLISLSFVHNRLIVISSRDGKDQQPRSDEPLFTVDSDSDTEEPFMSADPRLNGNAHGASIADVAESHRAWDDSPKAPGLA